MVDNWDENGLPVHISVAAYLGAMSGPKPATAKPSPGNQQFPPPPAANDKADKKTAKPKGGDLNELVAMFKGSNGVIR